jgi:hypothetical protein
VYVAIALMIAVTVAVAGFVLAPRLAKGRYVYDEQTDRPHPFGLGMAWLAIRTRDTGRLVTALGLQDIHASNWDTGIGSAYGGHRSASRIFISPPVNGWSFVVGLELPLPLGSGFADTTTPLLVDLGREFSDVQYFASYPALDRFAWARVLDGKLVRAFAIGDEGIVWNKGKSGREEKTLGLRLFELRGVRGRRGDAGSEIVLYPTEQHIMKLAAKWSLDPTRLNAVKSEPALGWVGSPPRSWRAQPLRKAA